MSRLNNSLICSLIFVRHQQIIWFGVNSMDWSKCALYHQDPSRLLNPSKNKDQSADGDSNLANNIQAFINENVVQPSKTKLNIVDLKQNDGILLIYATI